jgi:phosphopantothenoylcysteine decarboxylase/phosphopantothenate--cysteine ligase
MTDMNTLTNKRILLGITGGIAAYKGAEIIRRFQEAGAEVRVVMTRAACEFITPLTLQALSGNPVHLDLLDTKAEAAMGHIELARWADVVLVAPATADFIARLANGRGDDLLTTLCLATEATIALAPAMNQAMWSNKATSLNTEVLRDRGVLIFGPGEGLQACGDIGPGRLLEPERLVQHCSELFSPGTLSGYKVLITAGPTREAVDPVRYISNHSSGKQGFALAEAAVESGAKVTLIAGPGHLETPDRVERIDVVTAEQMLDAVMANVAGCDLFIGVAAVSDYRPKDPSGQKIKKDSSGDELTIHLVKNPDILSEVAALENGPFTVGFAAETTDVIQYAREKLQKKNLDLIIANDVSDRNIGFDSDENQTTVISNNQTEPLPQMSKHQLARKLIALIAERIDKK